jgi:hypothetical protein
VHDAYLAAQALQARLRERHPGLTARLLRRPDEHDPHTTWMEIYAFQRDGDNAGVTPQIEADIAAEAAVLAPFLAGDRHTEVFVPCVS